MLTAVEVVPGSAGCTSRAARTVSSASAA